MVDVGRASTIPDPAGAIEPGARVPLVSIVTATYNRSNILGFTIESVRRGSFQDWELLVVGDACTDDTARVVEGLGDRRIRFMNLSRNCGDQSGPNNAGARHARGRYVAFLNHDDLWTPDHLETALAEIRRTGADMVFTQVLAIQPDGTPALLGVMPDGRYTPVDFVPASSWFFRRDLVDRIGPWKTARRCYAPPSQEWIHRAWRAGGDLRAVPRVTVIAVQSGARDRAYARREERVHARCFDLLTKAPGFVDRERKRAVERLETRGVGDTISLRLRRIVGKALFRLAIRFQVHPMSIENVLRYGRKGGFIDQLRRNRGLPGLG